jgi:hypothetical protein
MLAAVVMNHSVVVVTLGMGEVLALVGSPHTADGMPVRPVVLDGLKAHVRPSKPRGE